MSGKRAREVYASKRWRRLRLVVLSEAAYRCAACDGYADEVHHRQPVAVGGDPYDPTNLTPLCRRCHLQGHRRDGQPGRPRSAARRAWHARADDSRPTDRKAIPRLSSKPFRFF